MKDSRDDNELLADLPLTPEQAEQTNAGAGNVTLIGPPAADKLEKVGLGTLILPTRNTY
jgi:hypothetical protein